MPIQTTRNVDTAAFARVHQQALLLVHACKDVDELPKSLLKELIGTYEVLRNEAPYFGKERAVLEDMANKLEGCFRMIIGNEVPGDRQPGVPRIV